MIGFRLVSLALHRDWSLSWRAPSLRVFNPSACEHGSDLVVAVRVSEGSAGGPPTSWVFRYAKGRCVEHLDLSAMCRERFGIACVADPKLFVLGEELWVTFNTGSPAQGNELYVLRLGDERSLPQRCEFPGRMPIEKNWQFVPFEDSVLAVYSVEPLVLLRSDRNSFDGSSTISFRVHTGDIHRASLRARSLRERLFRRSYSLGTPLLPVSSSRYRAVMHEKYHILGKRLYFGRLAELDLLPSPQLTLDAARLFASYPSLLGTLPRLNRNLISCTYFSGILGPPDRPTVTAGVNDAFAVSATIKWPERTQ